MLSLNKPYIAVFAVFLLASCGFQPLYGKKGTNDSTAQSLLSGIKIDPIPDRLGQEFRIKLEDQLNPGGQVPASPRYRLGVTLKHTESGIGVARDGTVSRYNVYLDSNYALYRIEDDQKMTSGSLRHVSSYNNILNQYFSTYVSQEDALKRGIAELAQLYRQRLAAYLTENDGNPPIQKKPPPPLNPLTPETPAGQNSITPVIHQGL